ncbi:putative holin-like toxin [Schleiferilactobacillus harbinensis]|jgi:hypothetical protein
MSVADALQVMILFGNLVVSIITLQVTIANNDKK